MAHNHKIDAEFITNLYYGQEWINKQLETGSFNFWSRSWIGTR